MAVLWCVDILDQHADCKDKRTLPSVQLVSVLENKETWLQLIRSAQSVQSKSPILNGSTNSKQKELQFVTNSATGDNYQFIRQPISDAAHDFRIKTESFLDNCNSEVESSAMTFPCINAAVDWLARGRDPKVVWSDWRSQSCVSDDYHLQVFVTGSLYLVGNTFIALDEGVQ